MSWTTYSSVDNVDDSCREEVQELQPLLNLRDPDRLFDSPLAERISTLFAMHASSDGQWRSGCDSCDGEADVGPETEGDPYDDLLLAGKAKHPSSNPREKECENAPSAVEAPKIAPVEGTIYLPFRVPLHTFTYI